MNVATEQTRQAAERAGPQTTPGKRDEIDLDLDRLVWDPEYRAAVRPLLRRAG